MSGRVGPLEEFQRCQRRSFGVGVLEVLKKEF